MSGPNALSFCHECGFHLDDWKFCPKCGTPRIENGAAGVSLKAAPSRATVMRLEVRSLIDEGDLVTAEMVVRRELKEERSLETLLVAADVFSRRHLVNE